jgi:DNA-binding transcriptional ArsR family regulator
MNETAQLALDFTARARRRDPETSQLAAGKVKGARLADHVLDELRVNGPGTSHELAERMKRSLVTISPRLRPLADAGLVEALGKRDGRTVWRAK